MAWPPHLTQTPSERRPCNSQPSAPSCSPTSLAICVARALARSNMSVGTPGHGWPFSAVGEAAPSASSIRRVCAARAAAARSTSTPSRSSIVALNQSSGKTTAHAGPAAQVAGRTAPPQTRAGRDHRPGRLDVVEAARIAHQRREVLLQHAPHLPQMGHVVGGPLMGDVDHSNLARRYRAHPRVRVALN